MVIMIYVFSQLSTLSREDNRYKFSNALSFDVILDNYFFSKWGALASASK
jgi:hypothetical protein